MVRRIWASAAVLLGIASAGLGCGANVSSAGHGSGSHGGVPAPHSHEITKGELLAAELLTAGAATAIEVAMKECPSMCITPAVCDHRTGLCKVEQVVPAPVPSGKSRLDPGREPAPTTAEPTCEGLCLPGERCVIQDGKQDCVALDKAPRRN